MMKNYFCIAVLFLLTGLLSLCHAQSQKPNIIFILADDLGYGDLGCYGSAKIKTPYIDRLAKTGMRFTDFYAGSTVCAPSRASLMTGQHTGHTNIRGNGEVPLAEADTILPQRLHQAGYTNGMVGKWGLGFDGSSAVPEKKGWHFFSGLLHHLEGHFQKPDSAWQLINGKTVRVKIPDNAFSNEWFKNEALRFIDSNRNRPFFLYVSFTLPHAELLPPQRFLKIYLNKDGSSKFAPEQAQPSGRHYGPQLYPRAAYAAMVTQMDSYVGEIVKRIKTLGLDNNTIIIFASDNGTHIEGGRTIEDVQNVFKSSGSLRGVKRDLYEGGIRAPFIVNWKGKIKAGKTNSLMAAFWDILPSFVELSGRKDIFGTDGVSFLPSLLGKQQTQHEYLYWEFYEGGFIQAVRTGEWKSIRFYKGKTPDRTELYNLKTDPGEKNNVAKMQPLIVKQMEMLMKRAHQPSDNKLFQIK